MSILFFVEIEDARRYGYRHLHPDSSSLFKQNREIRALGRSPNTFTKYFWQSNDISGVTPINPRYHATLDDALNRPLNL